MHLTTAPRAQSAARDGWYRQSTRGLSMDEVGFVHASTSSQVSAVASRYYADETDPLVLLVVDVDACTAAGSPVVWEEVAGAGVFPHVYGPIPWSAVVAQLQATLGDHGLDLPDLTAYDVVVEPPQRVEPGAS